MTYILSYEFVEYILILHFIKKKKKKNTGITAFIIILCIIIILNFILAVQMADEYYNAKDYSKALT